jgi:RHS repeat-associated protein
MAGAQTEVVEYYGLDALGSVRVVFDGSGVVVARSDYLPFGENLNPSGALPPWQFTGQIRDGEAGQDDFGARRYQPRHGRFTAVDPVYAGLFDPQQWNRYGYARSSPLRFVDPDGRALLTMEDLRASRDRMPRRRGVDCDEGLVEAPSGNRLGGVMLGFEGTPQKEPGPGPDAAAVDAVSLEGAVDLEVLVEGSGTDANPRSCRQELAAWRVCVQECREAKWSESVWDGAYGATKNVAGCFALFRGRAVPSAAQVALFLACVAGTGYVTP